MENVTGLTPTGKRVLVEMFNVEEKTAGGILITTTTQEKEAMAQTLGVLIAVGKGAEGHNALDGIAPGDMVLFARYSGIPLEFDKIMYRLMNVDDVCGKTTKAPDFCMRAARSSQEVFGVNAQ